MNADVDKNLMRRYLLGALPEDEQFKLEAEYFADNEKFEQVWELENELVDDYVRGGLGKQERDLFERNYLASPKHQERVAAARSLLQAADASIVEEEARTSHDPWWTTWKEFFRPPQLIWGGAVAMLLLVGWWFFRSPAQQQIAVGTPSPSVTKTITPIPATPSPLHSAQPTATQPESPSPKPQSSPSGQLVVPSVLAFTLLNVGVRGEDKRQSFVIPRGTKQVRLQMKLSGEEYQTYQVQLHNVDGAAIFRQLSLKPAANKKSVVATFSVAQLISGDYVVTLSGRNQRGEPEEVNKYFFRVARK